jgi:hypothetical protein
MEVTDAGSTCCLKKVSIVCQQAMRWADATSVQQGTAVFDEQFAETLSLRDLRRRSLWGYARLEAMAMTHSDRCAMVEQCGEWFRR